MKIRNSYGLSVDFLENGSVSSIEADPIRISLRVATPFSGSGSQLYLRKTGRSIEYKSLTGPDSNSRFTVKSNEYIASGNWDGLEYTVRLRLSEITTSWQWIAEIKNTNKNPVGLDIIYVQDAGLKQSTDALVNEYYVSQYTERRILDDSNFGPVICCRQNMKESGGHPWIMMACSNGALSASTDGMQFYGKGYRETRKPEALSAATLGGEYAGESSILALQEKPFGLNPGEGHRSMFAVKYLRDHPEATSDVDLAGLKHLFIEFAETLSKATDQELHVPENNIFILSDFLPSEDLNEHDLESFFGKNFRHREVLDGRLLSFFCGQNNHVMLRLKETLTDRPHASIMQTMSVVAPDENIISTTAFAYGVFNSHLTQGNTNFNVFLSVCSSQFNLSPETGQRIFVEIWCKKYLLGVPSAFEMGINHCRWIYKYGEHCFQICSWTSKKSPQVNMDFRVLSGKRVKLLITHHFDQSNGWKIKEGKSTGEYIAKPDKTSMIAGKFPDAQFRIIVNSTDSEYRICGQEALFTDKKDHHGSIFIIEVNNASDFYMSFIGEICCTAVDAEIKNAATQFVEDCHDAHNVLKELSLNLNLQGENKDISAIQEILPWYYMNALIHFLTPYGLEQFSGAAWGTRDVSQGPLDMLLCMEKYAEARQVLCTIFSNQNHNGGWPQWWMFDSYSEIRADSSHGDVWYWCIIALGSYIRITGDYKILDEPLSYYTDDKLIRSEISPLSEHLDRLIKMIVGSFIPGTALVPFGGGDWNDSLQPVSKELAQRLISSWTVEMNYQAFRQYQAICEQAGNAEIADRMRNICEKIKSDFNKYLIRDGQVAGYGLVEDDGKISPLLHPSDTRTGIRFSILPMNRGIISDIFTKEQALHHLGLIEMYLKGPDGARLMDRPLKYRGGIQKIFQRAESSTFFGREIGLMYVHEHIRYAESLALTGRADSFIMALRQAIPVEYSEIVPGADHRQANCYYSSSDVIFSTRYEADERYDEIKSGKIILRGGWRVYSSGPGIFIGLIVTRLIGLRSEPGKIILDPVIPKSLNGFTAELTFRGHNVKFVFEINDSCFGPKAITINGKGIKFSYQENKYRCGGAVIPADRFLSRLNKQNNTIEIEL